MPDVSDDDLRRYLRKTLKATDLNTTTEKKLRAQLEEHFGCDLKPRKKIFKEEIEHFLSQCDGLDEEVDEGEAAEEPAPKGKRKGKHTKQSLSEELREFLDVGESEDISRGEVVKRIWQFIREHDLQDPNNRRKILPDEGGKMATIFTFPLNMFTLNKQISRHVKAAHNIAGNDAADDPPAKKQKKSSKKSAKADGDGADAADTADKPKAKPSGFTLPQKLSPELAALLGVDTATRGDCSKRLWAYVKDKGLQDPANKSMIRVKEDPALYALLQVDECKGFSMGALLKCHFLGRADVAE